MYVILKKLSLSEHFFNFFIRRFITFVILLYVRMQEQNLQAKFNQDSRIFSMKF